MRMGTYQKTQWAQIDNAFKKEIRTALFLNEHSSLDYLYGSTSAGAMRIPVAAEESEIFRIDSAFKLLSTKDPIVQELAGRELGETVREATRKPARPIDISEWLNGDHTGRPGNSQTIWTNARGSTRRLEEAVKWAVNEKDELMLQTDSITLEPSHKRFVATAIRKVLRKRRDEKLQSLPSQGKAMKLVSKTKASSHFIRSGSFTRFVDWRFIHRARLNLLPVNGQPWVQEQGCRRCQQQFESLAHVLNHCPPALTNIEKRHNDIVRRIKTAVENPRTGCKLLYENETIPGAQTRDRPDLVIEKETTFLWWTSPSHLRTEKTRSKRPGRRRGTSTST